MSLYLLPFVLVWSVNGLKWPVPYVVDANTLPNLEVGLAAPANPFPHEEQAVRHQEHLQEEAEAARMDALRRSSRKVLVDARARTAIIIGRAMHTLGDAFPAMGSKRTHSSSFVETQMEVSSADAIGLLVDIEPAGTPNTTWTDQIVSLGRRSVDDVHQSRDQDISNMKALSDAILRELEVQLQEQLTSLNRTDFAASGDVNGARAPVGFTAMVGEDNVHVRAPQAEFPNVASVVQGMEARTAITEHLGQWTVLGMDMQLLQAERRMIKEMLDTAVGRAATFMSGAVPA
jgi:hypothetical protein